ncbi:MAG: hypothetical protein FWB98_04175 [Defluviitaleaceae bacterium]|nr:hypothetical protein [Defluviitaleaceae bacterium]
MNVADKKYHYKVKVSWFAGLLQVLMGDDQEEATLRIFGFKKKMPLNFGGEADETHAEAEKPHPEQVRATDETRRRLDAAKEQQKRKVNKRKKREKRKGESQWKKIKRLYEEIGEDHIKKIISMSWATIKKLIKRILPKKFKLRGKFGLGEPDRTGLALGVVSMLSTVLDIYLEADFHTEEVAAELDLQAKGGFRLWQLIYPALKLWLNPEIKRLRAIIKANNNKNIINLKRKRSVEYGDRIKPKHG